MRPVRTLVLLHALNHMLTVKSSVQMLAELGRLVANKVFKFSRGTGRSSYTQLYVAFFLSAVFHFVGEFT